MLKMNASMLPGNIEENKKRQATRPSSTPDFQTSETLVIITQSRPRLYNNKIVEHISNLIQNSNLMEPYTLPTHCTHE